MEADDEPQQPYAWAVEWGRQFGNGPWVTFMPRGKHDETSVAQRAAELHGEIVTLYEGERRKP